MKIQLCQSYRLSNKNQKKNTYSNKPNMDIYNTKKNISFLGLQRFWYGSPKKLQIFKRSAEELKDLAEYLHKFSQGHLDEVTQFYKIDVFVPDNEKTAMARKKLFPAVEKVSAYKQSLLEEIARLQAKEIQGVGTIVDQKNRLLREFINYLAPEKRGERVPPLTNGILLYGSSKEKESFITRK